VQAWPVDSFHRIVAVSLVVGAVGVGVGTRWHALHGDEQTADVVALDRVRRENSDGTTRENLMPRVRVQRGGTSQEAVVDNEFLFADLHVGDRVTVWVHGDEVVARDTGNDLLRGALVGFACGVLTYLGAALLTLLMPRK
jgi:hypothetical protein